MLAGASAELSYSKRRSTRRRTTREGWFANSFRFTDEFQDLTLGTVWRARTDIKVILSLHHFDCGVAKGWLITDAPDG